MTATAIIAGPEEFASRFDISRETLDRLTAYASLLERWQRRINLIGPSTVQDIWHRHIADSAQLLEFIPRGDRRVIDLGSGAGLPGVVLALLFGDGRSVHVHLVESNAKKAAFLREAIRVTAASATVHAVRIESIDPRSLSPAPRIVTARALAPLAGLLGLSRPALETGAAGIFLKGRDVDDELTEASKYWRLTVDRIPSRIHSGGTILIVKEASRVDT